MLLLLILLLLAEAGTKLSDMVSGSRALCLSADWKARRRRPWPAEAAEKAAAAFAVEGEGKPAKG